MGAAGEADEDGGPEPEAPTGEAVEPGVGQRSALRRQVKALRQGGALEAERVGQRAERIPLGPERGEGGAACGGQLRQHVPVGPERRDKPTGCRQRRLGIGGAREGRFRGRRLLRGGVTSLLRLSLLRR